MDPAAGALFGTATGAARTSVAAGQRLGFWFEGIVPTVERTLWRGAMSLDIDYVFGLASNSRLVRMSITTQEKALALV